MAKACCTVGNPWAAGQLISSPSLNPSCLSSHLTATQEPLALSDDLLVADGAHRWCYLHPTDPGLCVKIDKPLSQTSRPGRLTSLRHDLMPWVSSRPANVQEWFNVQRLARRHSAILEAFAPQYGAVVPTTRGPALLVENIRDPGGGPSPRVSDYLLRHPEKRAWVLAMIDGLRDQTLASGVRLYDVNPYNLLLQKKPESEVRRLVVVDWKSAWVCRGVLPIHEWVPALGEAKVRRRYERLKARLSA